MVHFLVTFVHTNWLQKDLELFLHGKCRYWPPLKLTAPFITRKKNSSDHRVYGTQNDRLELTVSTQKSVLKNMHRVPRYWWKCVGIWPAKPNLHIFGQFWWYLWTQCIFFKPDFCIETVSSSQSFWVPWSLKTKQTKICLIYIKRHQKN